MKNITKLTLMVLGGLMLGACSAFQQTTPDSLIEPTESPEAMRKTEKTPSPESTATGPAVDAENQPIVDSTVLVDRVVAEQDGWIVIHADDNGAPGAVIGQSSVKTGVNADVSVEVDETAATDTLYAMLHLDEGETGTYEFPGADVPVEADGEIVVTPFQVSDDAVMEAEETSVSMENIEFVPQTITVDAGDTVVWENNDSVLHTITGFGIDEEVPAGETFSYTFDEPGTYDYVCTIHPGMEGTVVVE